MTISELILKLNNYNLHIIIGFLTIPLAAFLFSRLITADKRELFPHKYVYSFLIYLTSIPGILALVITLYSLFIIKTNLLNVNLAVYFLPIFSMTATLVIIGKYTDLDKIPGFGRLSGLFTLLVVTFIFTIMILKTRIWIFFGGSIKVLIIIIIVLFIVLKYATKTVMGKKNRH